jgi:hypothetical protein
MPEVMASIIKYRYWTSQQTKFLESRTRVRGYSVFKKCLHIETHAAGDLAAIEILARSSNTNPSSIAMVGHRGRVSSSKIIVTEHPDLDQSAAISGCKLLNIPFDLTWAFDNGANLKSLCRSPWQYCCASSAKVWGSLLALKMQRLPSREVLPTNSRATVEHFSWPSC